MVIRGQVTLLLEQLLVDGMWYLFHKGDAGGSEETRLALTCKWTKRSGTV